MAERLRIRGTAPVGPLADVLQRYGAPEDVQRFVARRAGSIVGTPTLPVAQVEGIITKSRDGKGRPDWGMVQDQVGEKATAAYRSYRRG